MTQPTNSLTEEGVILGTLQYMAPEQLEGKEADSRSDIFAFGAVVYEMATGKKAFEGKSRASLIAAILEREPPPISSLQSLTPSALDHIVRTCVARDPEQRWQSAADLARELRWIAESGKQSPGPTSVGHSRGKWMWLAAIAIVSLVASAFVFTYFTRKSPGATARFSFAPPFKAESVDVACSCCT